MEREATGRSPRGRAIVTGGLGFIGSHLVDALETRGDLVVTLDSAVNPADMPIGHVRSSRVYLAGIRSLDYHDPACPLRGWVGEAPVDVIYHLAALGSVPRSLADPLASWETNVSGTVRVFEFARAVGASRVVVTSSSSVYGGSAGGTSLESAVLDPRSPYASTKAAMEFVAKSYADSFGLEVVIMRLFNVIGARQRADTPYSGVLPRLARAILTGTPITLHGEGRARRDFIFVGHVVEALIRAGTYRIFQDDSRPRWRVINVARGESISVAELLDVLIDVAGVKPTRVLHEPSRQGDVALSRGDPRELLRELHLTIPEDTVRLGVESAVAHAREKCPRSTLTDTRFSGIID